VVAAAGRVPKALASVTKGGVTVSLLGIASEAAPGRWWGLKGEEVAAPIPPRPWAVRAPREQVYRFAIAVEGAPDAELKFKTDPLPAGMTAYFARVAGSSTVQVREAQLALPAGAKGVTVTVAVPSGEWVTVASAGRPGGAGATTRPGDGAVTFGEARRVPRGVAVAVTHGPLADRSVRVVATVDGKDVVGTLRVTRVAGEEVVSEVEFDTVRPLGRIRLEARAREAYEFKGLPLRAVAAGATTRPS
jgi:hypothetical protein